MKLITHYKVLFLVLGIWSGNVWTHGRPNGNADNYELQARFYLAGDDQVGSFLTQNPYQRHMFGFPMEPITEFSEGSATYPDFNKDLIESIWKTPAWQVTGEVFPATGPAVELFLDWKDINKEFIENPNDVGARAKVVSGIAKLIAGLTTRVGPQAVLTVVAAQIDRAVQIASLIRSRDLANRALAQVRLPFGTHRQVNARLQERISKRSGAFRMEGNRFRAQGGWNIDHKNGIRSSSFARYDFKNYYLPNGAIISTLGSMPDLLSLEDAKPAKGSQNKLDFIFNTIGKKSNYFGRNVTGGDNKNFKSDEFGELPLKNTELPGLNIVDSYARLHDIEYYVSTHFPKGTEVRVAAPNDTSEYFISEGSPRKANLRVAAKISALSNITGVLNAIITRNYKGRKTPRGNIEDVVDVTNKNAMKVIDRRKKLKKIGEGIYREQLRIRTSQQGLTIVTNTHASYRITYNGAAISKAVEDYNRTGVWNPDKYTKRHSKVMTKQQNVPIPQLPGGLDFEEPPMIKRQTGDDVIDFIQVPFNNDDDDDGGGGGFSSNDNRVFFVSQHNHDHKNVGNVSGNTNLHSANQGASSNKFGGVSLEIDNLITFDNSQFANKLGSKVVAASKVKGGKAEIILGGKRYFVARSSSATSKGKNLSTKQHKKLTRYTTKIGSYFDYQIDLLINEDKHSLVALQRFYDSTSIKKNGQGGLWTWHPFELRFESTVPDKLGSQQGNEIIVLIDRVAGLELKYRLEKSADNKQKSGLVKNYHGLTHTYQPRIKQLPNGDYQALFQYGFIVQFDKKGRLLWQSGNQESQIKYEYQNGRLINIVRGKTEIILSYGINGRLKSAKGSNGERVNYIYNSQGQLVQVNSKNNEYMRYKYNEGGFLTETKLSSKSKSDDTIVRNTYDTKGRMLVHESVKGAWRFKYDDNNARILITDREGITTSYFYDSSERLVGYGSDENAIMINYGQHGELLQLGRGIRTQKPASNGKLMFKVTELLTPFSPL